MLIDTCPANFFGRDIPRMANRYHLADGRVSFAEQAKLPFPYLQALHVYRNEVIRKQEHDARRTAVDAQLAKAAGRR